MSSTYPSFPPPSMIDQNQREGLDEPRNTLYRDTKTHAAHHHHYHHQQYQPQYQSARPIHTVSAPLNDLNRLSPFSAHPYSNSASPTLHDVTPADSASCLSLPYQSSDFGDIEHEDPYFGVNFGLNLNGADASSLFPFPDAQPGQSTSAPVHGQPHNATDFKNYPLSPEQSLHTSSPHSDKKGPNSANHGQFDPFALQDLNRALKHQAATLDTSVPATQLTPVTSAGGSGRSSDDGLVPAAPQMAGQSPRVTVSLWGRDHDAEAQAYSPEVEQPHAILADYSADDSFIGSAGWRDVETSIPRGEFGNWLPDAVTGHGGLDPNHRPSGEVPSANEMASHRQADELNQEVSDWVEKTEHVTPNELPGPLDTQNLGGSRDTDDDGIPLGDQTENQHKPGQTYFEPKGGEMTQEDLNIMQGNRNWENAPLLHRIQNEPITRFQPETSNLAIQRFQKLCQDNESIASKAATWGTRRRSLPSIIDIENITSGNFLKKLSISRDDKRRRPSLLQEIRTLVRKPSANQILKRNRTDQDIAYDPEPGFDRRDSQQQSLAPPSRTTSWGKKQATPSINTALISMGSGMASVGGAGHVRSGSIGGTPVTSPRSPFGALPVNKLQRRPRSKSDLPKTPSDGPHSHLVAMWEKTGGPPVAALRTTGADQDDDDDEEEELYENANMKAEADRFIDDIKPNFNGFQQHVLHLNPSLADANGYLVERLAHQQVVRYKGLLVSRVKHLQHIQAKSCPCGSMCIALGGCAVPLSGKADYKAADPLSARFDVSDGDVTPLEGAITPDSFPQDIPMPPAQSLPAEFECQLCYQQKKFQKPSDWTKHVHEDVQPFTCTWDRCRDPKIFKRKADWVRHENEGHRHLEWWTCDVEDCRHTCYRRDNFLQHLVREHKFPEPKVKTKAALKRAGGVDPTWQKVEQCHVETSNRPQDEPCRFCGKTFPTWKKLTVHLAKHMEQISLPILRLVARKELEPDTIISPVQDPPPRSFAPLTQSTTPVEQGPFGATGQTPIGQSAGTHLDFTASLDNTMYSVASNPTYGGFYGYEPSIPQYADNTHLGVGVSGLMPQQQFQNVPVTSSYMSAPNADPYVSMSAGTEPFPAFNSLAIQDSSGGLQQYDTSGMMDPTSIPAGEHFTTPGQFMPQGHYGSQGSVSPFSRSPNQGQGGFYHQ